MTFLTTFTGGKVDYANPQPEQINMMDIATALSRECRYAGRVPHKTPGAAEPMNGRIWPLSPKTAKDQFLDRFRRLQPKGHG